MRALAAILYDEAGPSWLGPSLYEMDPHAAVRAV